MSLDHPQIQEGVVGEHQMEEAFQVVEVVQDSQVTEAEGEVVVGLAQEMPEQELEPQMGLLKKMMPVQHWLAPRVQLQTENSSKIKFSYRNRNKRTHTHARAELRTEAVLNWTVNCSLEFKKLYLKYNIIN